MTSYSNVQKQQLSQLGAYLQEKRQDQGRSLEDISLQTYIRTQLLKAVEAGDPTDLPQPIFVQGFIRRYADALGLDGTNFAKQFPVHSIPNTPRPVPRPAIQVNMAPPQQGTALTQPKAVSPPPKPERVVPKPAVGAMPVVKEESIPANLESESLVSKASAEAPARAFNLESHPGTDGERTAIGLNPPANGADRISSGAFLGNGDTVPPALEPPRPSPVGTLGLGATDTRKSGGSWLPWGIGAVVMVGAIALLLPRIFGGDSSETEPVEVEAPAPTEVVQAEPVPEPAESAEPALPVSEAPVNLSVEITEAGPSWMSITVDGAVVFEGELAPGAQETWEGETQITMNVGNAGAAIISANGSEPTPAGNPGGAEVLTFTPAE